MSTKMRGREHDDPVEERRQNRTEKRLMSNQPHQLSSDRVATLRAGVSNVCVYRVYVQQIFYRVRVGCVYLGVGEGVLGEGKVLGVYNLVVWVVRCFTKTGYHHTTSKSNLKRYAFQTGTKNSPFS